MAVKIVGFCSVIFVLIVSRIIKLNCAAVESSTCLTIYKHGGAPAVFRSRNCPLWNLQNRGTSSVASRCHTAAIQGRRKYQEDRLVCALNLRIPFPGTTGPKDLVVGIAAVFDGHNGAEASEMASKLLLDYFALHTHFLLDATFSLLSIGTLPNPSLLLHHDFIMHPYDLNSKRFQDSLPLNFDHSLHLDILKEALLRTLYDIDATFTMEASTRNLDSGSTATIALIADGQLLVASIGDSKAVLCSERFETPEEARATSVKLYRERRRNPDSSSPSRFSDLKLQHRNGLVRLVAKELTKDHHPNREDEKIRVEAAGGYVTEWAGVARVNSQLAVSRSIGDLPYKSYGVVSAPEVMDWKPLVANDSYLVVSSDGIFEKLEVQDVCDRLWEVNNQTSYGAGGPPSVSLADCLVDTAFEKGAMDNMAAVVVPLKSSLDSHTLQKEQQPMRDEFASGLQEEMWKESYGKHDLESAQTPLYPMMMESPELRWSFIRKVYSIISIQLLVTIAVAATVVKVHPISVFFTTTGAGFALYILIIFTPLIVMCPLYYYHQKHPFNYILLAIFTVSLAFAVGLTCAFTSGKVILESVILTSVVVISLTLYTFWAAKRGHDFNFLGPFLFGAVIVLMVFSFIQILFPLGKISVMIYGCVASIIFCGYIVYDTDNLIKRHSYDEYIWAAVSLYLDVINLFLSLLSLLRAADS